MSQDLHHPQDGHLLVMGEPFGSQWLSTVEGTQTTKTWNKYSLGIYRLESSIWS